MIEGFDEDFLPAGWIAQDALSRKRFPNYTRLAKILTRVDSFHAVDLLNISFGVRSTTGGQLWPILGRRRPGERPRWQRRRATYSWRRSFLSEAATCARWASRGMFGNGSPLGPCFCVARRMTSWLARSVAVSWAPAPLRSATRSCPRTGVRAMPPVRRVTWWSRARASLGIERVVAHAPVDRPASGRLLAKAGFTCHSPSVTAWWRLSGPRARAPGWVVMLSAARPKGRPHGLPVSFAWQGAAVVCAVKGGRRPSRSEDPGRLGQRRRRRGTARGAAGAAPAGRHRRCRGRGGAVALLPQRPAAGTGGSGAGGVPDGAQERRRRGAGDVRGRDRGDDPTPGGGRRSTAAQVQRLGGHSLRAGFVTEAFRRGADAHAIIRQTGTGPRSPVPGDARGVRPGHARWSATPSPASASDQSRTRRSPSPRSIRSRTAVTCPPI